MTKKYKNKYRIESARKKGYDYSHNGAYFLTIVTKNRECFFGNIVNADDRRDVINRVSTMKLSEIGKIVQKYWDEIPRHFPFIRLDEMVVMPNHIHGILWIDKSLDVETANVVSVETPKLGVSTTKRNPNHHPETRNNWCDIKSI